MSLRALAFIGQFAIAPFVVAPVFAACINPAPAGPPAIASFNASPSTLLDSHAEGGAELINQVRNLVVSDAATVNTIVGLAARANPQQRAAIGTGLAQAAGACVRTEATTAQAIQEAIVLASNNQMAVAFRAAAGDVRTASVSAGGAAGGGLGGAGIQVSSAFSTPGRSAAGGSSTASFANPGASMPTGGGSSVTVSGNRTAFRSVSPF